MRRLLFRAVFWLLFLRFLPLGTDLHAQDNSTGPLPVETPQVTAVALTPLVMDDGQNMAVGTFKIMRTGETSKAVKIYVSY